MLHLVLVIEWVLRYENKLQILQLSFEELEINLEAGSVLVHKLIAIIEN